MKKWRIIFYIAIPIIAVLICRFFKVAQGEKNEEVIFGIMIGILIDLIAAIILSMVDRIKEE